ncbi:MAG: TonB-dependent receptor [Robiginitomaculum sp.]|nr:TonB-dependent receptor [Robiginitomaculum sp.]
MNNFTKSTVLAGMLGASTIALAMAMSTSAFAQQITSSVRGIVTAPDGTPAVGEAVTITDTRTGASRTVRTSSNGGFSARGLTVGGPYTVRVDSDRFQDTAITDISLGLSGSTDLNFTLQERQDNVDEIIVTATRANLVNLAVGPSSSFDLATIEAFPSVSRQIRDIIRIDPRVNIGRGAGGRGFQVNCLGGNSRGNAFTIDGIRSGDSFGLNSSGTSARNTFPVPFDSVAATAVEFSPIDVQYGQFTGCAINATTKSGTNEFSGSIFGLYTGDGLTGSKIEDRVIEADFDNYNWGAEIGGPIIKDKLFFYGAYEETDAAGIQSRGIGAGFANPITEFSLDEANRAAAAIQNIFGRDVGEQVTALPRTSRRFFGRLDWNINDDHRLEGTYAKLEELALAGDGIGGGRSRFTFADSFFNVGSDSNSYSLRLFSNWTDNFSTEIRASRIDIGDIQDPFGGGEQQSANPIPRVSIGPFGNEFFGQNFGSGPGIFRSANQLDTRVDQLKIAGTYVKGDHTITAGYELDRLDIFNLFVINATGTLFFDDVAALEAGTPRLIRQNGSFTGDINDAAASFSRNNHTLYIQDEWQINQSLQLVAGLRYDFFTSGDVPQLNPVFQQRYGFANSQAFDGFEIFQPRIGLTWNLPTSKYGDTTLTAGYGRFTGGDPTVFFSNAFQNFGGTIALGDAGDGFGSNDVCTDADLATVIVGGQFQGLPTCLAQEQQARTAVFDADVAATDPNFTPPSVDRFSLGLSHFVEGTGSSFLDGWNANLDFIYSRNRNAIDFIDLSIAQNGTAPDGRPIFANIDPLLAGCSATLSDDLRTYNNTSAACFAGADVGQSIILTNAVNGGGQAISFSAQFTKQFEIANTATMDLRLGYAYSDAEVGNAGNSSTAGSNFEEVTTSDFNNVPIANSFFNNRHNFVVGATFREQFWDNLDSTFGVFFRARTGRPLSFVFDAGTSRDAFGDSDDEARSLLYIPTGPTDPLVTFAPGFDQAGFFNFIEQNNLSQFAGSIVPRGAVTQPTTADIDLRFTQEVPTLIKGHKLEFSVNFENFLNFIDKDAGVQRFVNTSNTAEGVDVLSTSINANGQFVFDDFNPDAINIFADTGDTLWRIQIGAKYKF